MFDLYKAIFGECPWCELDETYTKYDKLIDAMPSWLFRLWVFRLDELSVWRLGMQWHRKFHPRRIEGGYI